MAIEVKIKCSDCGTISDRSLTAGDTEIICPECRRNMPNLSKDEFRSVSRTLTTQSLLGVIAVLAMIGAAVLMYFYVGEPKNWISGSAAKDTSQFLYGAIGCIVIAAVFGVLSALKRFVVEF